MFLQRTRRSALGGSGVALLAAAAALVAVAMPSAHAADTPLRDLAAAKGIYMGTALTAGELTGTSASIAGTQFGSVTPGNEMKWDTVEPTRGTYNWGPGDSIVAFAKQHSMQVRGHNLVWHSQLPGWLTSGSFTNSQLHDIMIKHVTDEVTHYKGEITHWDVVNEPFNEDGTFRSDLWYNQLGSSYIADAFTAAHAADPAAKLYVNDYNIEGSGAKSDGMYNLVKSLKQQGVPIDGVGFQAHFILGQVPSTFKANMQRFADLGVDVAVTELDVRMQLPVGRGQAPAAGGRLHHGHERLPGVSRCRASPCGASTTRLVGAGHLPRPGRGHAVRRELPAQARLLRDPVRAGRLDHDPAPDQPADDAAHHAAGRRGTCTVAYAVNEWATGFTANVTVTSASAVTGWTVALTYPGGSRTVTQAWNATVAQSGSTVTARNLSYNGSVAAGGSATYGFNADWSGSDPRPTGATLNGTACTIS